MKHYIYFLISILFFSCDFKKLEEINKKNEKINEILDGNWNENVFSNEFFDLNFTLDTCWTKTFEDYNSTFGGNYLEANHNEKDRDGNPIAEIQIDYTGKTFFEKKPTEKKNLLKQIMKYKNVYSEEQLEISPITDKQIGKHKFLHTNIKINSDDYDFNVDLYLRKVKSYSLIFELIYTNDNGLKACNQFLDSIK